MDNNYSTYSPLYNRACGNYDVILKKINKSILSEFKKLGISEYKKTKGEKYLWKQLKLDTQNQI